jgi:Ca-activated chloride channel family protein
LSFRPAVRAGSARFARPVGAALRGLGLLLLIVALAGPRWPDLRTRVETEGIALVLLVDVSGSMAEPDFDWNGEPTTRLDAVKRAFRLFVEGGRSGDRGGDGADATALEGRPRDLVALVPFATRPDPGSPLTLSHSALLRMLDAEEPRRQPGESETNLSDAVAAGLDKLQRGGPRRKVLVLLTDGEHNVAKPASGWTPRQAAQVAGSLNVPIYVLDAGGDLAVAEGKTESAGASAPQSRAEAVRTLQDMARISGGRYFAARDTSSLLAACREMDQLERTPVKSFQYRRYHEGYPWFGLAALLCWTVALALERTIWRRFP